MPWQVLYSDDEVFAPERRPGERAPQPSPARPIDARSALAGPVRLRPISLTIGADGTLRPGHDDEEDFD